jgi:lysophospholipase L1-like esterase
MHHLATAHGARYFHFLQPNQYVEGSKPMTPEEHTIAVTERGEYAKFALDGYPALIEAGAELREEGVNFFDLTQVFSNNREVLYRDLCCHLNERGYDLITEAVADRIDGSLDE